MLHTHTPLSLRYSVMQYLCGALITTSVCKLHSIISHSYTHTHTHIKVMLLLNTYIRLYLIDLCGNRPLSWWWFGTSGHVALSSLHTKGFLLIQIYSFLHSPSMHIRVGACSVFVFNCSTWLGSAICLFALHLSSTHIMYALSYQSRFDKKAHAENINSNVSANSTITLKQCYIN